MGFNKPNSAGPRYRQENFNAINEELLDIIKKKYPEYASLTLTQIREIVKAFNTQVCNTVIEERYGVELPERLGLVFIGTCKPRKKANPNYRLSAEYRRMVENRNWESDNNLAKIFFSPITYGSRLSFANRELWGLNPARWFKTKVGHTYPYFWKRYIEVDPRKKLSYLFKNNVQRMKHRDDETETAQQLKPYNEFDLD